MQPVQCCHRKNSAGMTHSRRSPWHISGAMKLGVPAVAKIMSDFSQKRAEPKSEIFTFPELDMSRLSGFRSPCTILA